MVTADELRKKYIAFFVDKGHKEIPSASLIPENDPSTLFISAGMHPLVPYLLGEPHPAGKRLCSVQKCVRTGDIEAVGDFSHLTFFEMLGNWSLGDYWKDEAIDFSFEFLTRHLDVNPKKLSVTCFAGDKDAPRDEESAGFWRKVGIPRERIFFLGKEDNWWGPAGKTGPCGPDSEIFFDTGREKCGSACRPGCSCGKYMEIWNDVFMQYNKTAGGKFEPLKQKNVDTGMGIERTLPVLNGRQDVYETELFTPIIGRIEEIARKKYAEEGNRRAMRIIADHLRAAVFMVADGVIPSNTEQGYVLRRLVRRAVRFGRSLSIDRPFAAEVAESVLAVMGSAWPEIIQAGEGILTELSKEEERFSRTLSSGLKEFEKLTTARGTLSGQDVFFLYETYGFPFELSAEMAKEKGFLVDESEFLAAQDKHQQKSRAGAEKKFAGGLADHSETVTRYHTATHLLQAALRRVLGNEVRQKGSNLTAERLRFDFNWPEKLTEEQLRQVEEMVNRKIKENIPVKMEIMNLKEAKKKGATALFQEKYQGKVKVYFIGDFSAEVCGGPHVSSTGAIKSLKITKEESCGSGCRRIYAVI